MKNDIYLEKYSYSMASSCSTTIFGALVGGHKTIFVTYVMLATHRLCDTNMRRDICNMRSYFALLYTMHLTKVLFVRTLPDAAADLLFWSVRMVGDERCDGCKEKSRIMEIVARLGVLVSASRSGALIVASEQRSGQNPWVCILDISQHYQHQNRMQS